MKLTLRLTDALHARPANLLVRLASTKRADIVIRRGEHARNAKNILDVLSLGAARGDEVTIELTGDDEEAAAEAIRELIEKNFDTDLVPDVGTAGVEGVAIGTAIVVEARGDGADREAGTPEEEAERAAIAFARVGREIDDLLRALGPGEATLFEPEVLILRELAPRVTTLIFAGLPAEAAVVEATEGATTDLVLDARARLLDALSGATPPELALHAEAVLVTDSLTPSLVAVLPPSVVGLVAGLDLDKPAGFTSHAAILARGREIPLAFVPSHVTAGITNGDLVVVDTTESPARVWVSPSATLVEAARAKRAGLARAREEDDRAPASLLHLGVAVRVNIGALGDVIPRAAEGIGLLRTELLFAGRGRAPSEAEQLASVLAVARKSRGGPVVARLFDAGGDKPVGWLAPPPAAPGARGIALLFLHGEVLDAQLRALGRAAEAADVRVLLPLAGSERDVHDVRARLARPLLVGAMIETPDAVDLIEPIAAAADFVCVGTNDLAALILGVDRADATLSLDRRVVSLVRRIVQGTHARGKQVTVCGEMAGDERGARILVGLGVDALSVAPGRVGPIRRLLAGTTREACERAAREAELG